MAVGVAALYTASEPMTKTGTEMAGLHTEGTEGPLVGGKLSYTDDAGNAGNSATLHPAPRIQGAPASICHLHPA